HPLHGERDHDTENHGQEIAEKAQDKFFHRSGIYPAKYKDYYLKKRKVGRQIADPLIITHVRP
ncbi:MAG: hypothetical protein J5692_03970, partial [Bacteroidales bacterium]|nr:hypothetical protein [Bacteroidales bacterium]